jgi:hypothetical protein
VSEMKVNTMKKMALGAAAAVVSAGAVLGTGQAHARPNADPTEERLTCNVFDKWTPDYGIGQAVTAAVMGVMGDNPGMSMDDAYAFTWKSIDDYCPKYRPLIEAAVAKH